MLGGIHGESSEYPGKTPYKDSFGRSSAAIGSFEPSPDALESSGSLLSHKYYEMLRNVMKTCRML